MIGAVVGTFTVTLALFIFGCCLLRIHKRSRYKVRSKILLHHTTSENSYRNFSPASENLKSPPHSSTSNHLLSNPSNNNNDSGINPSSNNNVSYSLNPVPNTLVNSYTANNFITGNGTLVNEFNGMKHLPYMTPTYEPINSTGDFQTSTGYSDSQTYDLPRILPTHSPPTIPLPPLPNGFINNASNANVITRLNEMEHSNTNTINIDNNSNNNSNNNHLPLLMTTLPYIKTAQSINNDINRCVDTSILSPFLMNDTQTLSAAMSNAAAAATLNLHMKHQQQQHFNSNHNRNSIPQHNQHFTQNNAHDNIIVQNQLIDLITRQNLFNQQLHDIQH